MRFLFGRGKPSAAKGSAEAIHDQLIATVRQPIFYTGMGVPDTFLGRFELLVLLSAPVLRRLRGDDAASRDVSQELVDSLFQRLDISMRELGVGDISVPKRMKKLGEAFKGRLAVYDEALAGADEAALAAAIGRNVLNGLAAGHELAGFVMNNDRSLQGAAVDPLRPETLRIEAPKAVSGGSA